MLTAVLDTNIYISAIGFDGKPEQLIRLAQSGTFIIFISPEIKSEITTTLTRKFHHPIDFVKDSLMMIELTSTTVYPKQPVHQLSYTPDNRILECCLEVQANYLVTGDKKHLLPLHKYKNTKIVTAQQFLKIVTT